MDEYAAFWFYGCATNTMWVMVCAENTLVNKTELPFGPCAQLVGPLPRKAGGQDCAGLSSTKTDHTQSPKTNKWMSKSKSHTLNQYNQYTTQSTYALCVGILVMHTKVFIHK